MIITSCLFQEPLDTKFRRIKNPKPLRQIARENIKIDNKN